MFLKRGKPYVIFNEKAWRYILGAWIFIWIFVFCKNLFVKGYLEDYKELLSRRNIDGMRGFVTGDGLYEFIKFCEISIPEEASFNYGEHTGITCKGQADRRIRYYLYPRIKKEKMPDFILFFNGDTEWVKGHADAAYKRYKTLDSNRYILMRDI